ncbi:MAG: hypothetical protein ACR2O5_05910 [Thiogranum sp.]
MKRPARQIIDTIEYNLKQLDGLSIAEPDLLKETTDTLVEQWNRSSRLGCRWETRGLDITPS